MFPLMPSLITGGASLLGSMFSSMTASDNSAANIAMQQQTNQMNMQESQRNRDFQEQMSNTAYQRSSADMQKAGLNPAMMFGSGGPASTPGGSTATAQAPHQSNVSPFAGLGDAASKAVSTAVDMKTFDKMTQEIANLKTQQSKTAAETVTERKMPERVEADTVLKRNEAERLAALYPSFKLGGTTAKDVLDTLPEWLRKSLNVGSYAGGKASDVLAPILNSATRVRGLLPSRSTSETASDGMGGRFTDRWEGLYR